MTDPLTEQDDASTPLSPEEREGLIPSYIALRGELNEAEQANILEDDAWAFARKRDVLDEGFLNTLYKRMSGNVMRARRQSAPSSRVLPSHAELVLYCRAQSGSAEGESQPISAAGSGRNRRNRA